MSRSKILFLMLCAFTFKYITAHDLSFYAPDSKLASGKWIKIKISETGVYEITNEEIKKFGFSDPQKVNLYGYGGTMLPEVFSASQIDDINQVPVLRTEDKIIFYGQGPVLINITSPTSTTPRYTQQVNSYSSYGYYFLSDIQASELPVTFIDTPDNGVYDKAVSYDYYYHEKEETSLSRSGKQFLGENMISKNSITLDFKLPQLVPDEKIIVNVAVAMLANATGYINTKLNGENVSFLSNSNKLAIPLTQYIYYTYSAPFTTFQPQVFNENISLETNVTCDGNIKSIRFDYLMLTYKHYNRLSSEMSQIRMGYQYMTQYDRILISGSDKNTVVWNIDNPEKPLQYTTSLTPQNDNSYTLSFTPKISGSWNQFIAFNKNETLKKVEFDSEIKNQNLHRMEVPDMVIITPQGFYKYAEMIANHHRETDKMDVAVIEHTSIFNEFSSGTPDPTAYRRFNKMLYDKNKSKYKFFLLFGSGSYDNRKLIGNKDDNMLMTYQSNVSNDEYISYTSDDYFGFLDDNSGNILATDVSLLCIGRIPVDSELEAQRSVDKLLDYINNNTYGSWRNNVLIVSDEGDQDLHMYQAEGIHKLLSDTLGMPFQINKVYVEAYPLAGKFADAGRTKIKDYLSQGQIFVTYIGHGGPDFLTKTAQIWRKEDVNSLSYKNIPVFSLSTCDVGRFDSDNKGIAEVMFLKQNGGAIACFASTRTVTALDNDELNREFIRNIFTKGDDGNYRTIGESFRNSKYILKDKRVINKLNFALFGDPAMKLHYPEPQVRIETINNVTFENAITVSPMTKMTLTGSILADNGEINDSFNGTVYMSLYDKAVFFKTVTFNNGSKKDVIDIHFQNNEINRVEAGIKNGKFSISCIIPSTCQANNEKITVRVLACNSETGDMATGYNSNITLNSYNEDDAIKDNTPPVIKAMYIDNPDFTDGSSITESGIFHVEFEDENGLNPAFLPIGHSISILIDGKESYRDLCNNFKPDDEGRSGIIEFPLVNLSYGYHTITFKVSDLANNRTTQSISFYVQPATSAADITVEESPARENATFNISHSFSNENIDIKLTITDRNGEMIWNKKTSSLPVKWDLTNIKGEKVDDGIYFYHAIIESGNQSGYTENKKIIVLKQ